MTTASTQLMDTIVYRVQAGDTLGAIIKHYYGSIPPDKQRAVIIRIQANNPDIKNPDRIYRDQLIRLEVPAQYCPAPLGFPYHFETADANREWFITTAQLGIVWSGRAIHASRAVSDIVGQRQCQSGYD